MDIFLPSYFSWKILRTIYQGLCKQMAICRGIPFGFPFVQFNYKVGKKTENNERKYKGDY